VTRPIVEAGRVLYVVEVAESLQQVDVSLRRLRLWLFLFVVAALLLTGTIGSLVGRLTRGPIRPFRQNLSRAVGLGNGR